MPKVHIDISLFTPNTAFGMVSGPFDLPAIPEIGDLVSFQFAEPVNATVGEQELPFRGQLRVTDRIVEPNSNGAVLLMLEDLTAATSDDAQQLMNDFERVHGLFGDIWGEPPENNP